VKDLLRRPLIKVALTAVVLALLLWGLNRLRDVLTPFAIAFTLAYFLNPPVNAMERGLARLIKRVGFLHGRLNPRLVAVGILAVAVVLVLILVLLFVVPAGYHQASDTAGKVPEYLKLLRAKIEPAYQRLHVQYPQQTEEVQQRALNFLKDNLPQILSPATVALKGAFSNLLSFVLTLLNLVIIPVFAFYLLYDMNEIRAGIRDLVPVRYRPYLASRVGEVEHLLSAFVRGQITVCLILGSFYAVALTWCGVPMGLLVGMAIGFFNLVPFMSYILGLPLALLLSWLDDQSLPTLGAVAAVFLVGQFVEGNIVTPRIVGDTLGLHAVVIMLAVLVGGTLFGFVGMLVAVPTTAALSVFWGDLREWYLDSAFYVGTDPPTA
jgi:predicted PurR-regulated permease PerM